ncbi:MAG: hypothetical protein HYY04_04145 [Chloroflexi bacterium]|nr:hypothetical protein [Chloroflexota bacterium]
MEIAYVTSLPSPPRLSPKPPDSGKREQRKTTETTATDPGRSTEWLRLDQIDVSPGAPAEQPCHVPEDLDHITQRFSPANQAR